MTRVRIQYGADVSIMDWDGAQASAPILVDGRSTPWQTADALHYTDRAVRLVCGWLYGAVYETEDDAAQDGRDPTSVCIWDEVSYDTLDEEDDDDVQAAIEVRS